MYVERCEEGIEGGTEERGREKSGRVWDERSSEAGIARGREGSDAGGSRTSGLGVAKGRRLSAALMCVGQGFDAWMAAGDPRVMPASLPDAISLPLPHHQPPSRPTS